MLIFPQRPVKNSEVSYRHQKKTAAGPRERIVSMDNFDKVEKLVNKAGVSYEEAKQALEMTNGDLLDAMIYLEKEGKTQAPKKSSYSTQYEDQTNYTPVGNNYEGYGTSGTTRIGAGSKEPGKVKTVLKKIWHALSVNFLVIKRHEEMIIKMPLWLMLVILLAAWHVSLILIVISLFFGFTYSFKGEADLKAVNDVMEKASDVAEKVKEEVNKM